MPQVSAKHVSVAYAPATVMILLAAGLSALPAHADPLPTDPAMEHVTNFDHGVSAGIWVRDGYLFSTGWYAGAFSIINVSDPENPVVVDRLPLRARDVDLLDLETEDGDRTIAVLAHGSRYVHFVDVTDPENAFHTSTLRIGGISHNIAALPGTDYVYNSRSSSVGIDIINVSDPENPFVEKVWNGVSPGCHDVTVYPEVGRAYCAAIYHTSVLDISDPLEPSIIWRVENDAIQIHHWALANQDHTMLIIGDEGGFWAPEDGCDGSTTTPIGTIMAGEGGAVWFYDIGPLADLMGGPVEISHVSLPENNQSPCTAHFGELIDDQPLIAVAWYTAGVVLIDFGGPGLPRIQDQIAPDNAYTWDVRHEDGYLYTGDVRRGLDVIRLNDPLVQV